tara:strand:+ start:416 stop:766 length:351 start_codon:yes stop_codon:yes gene_type:complete
MEEPIILRGWVRKVYTEGYGFNEIIQLALLLGKLTNKESALHYLEHCFEISALSRPDFLNYQIVSNKNTELKRNELTTRLGEELMESITSNTGNIELKKQALLKLLENVFRNQYIS